MHAWGAKCTHVTPNAQPGAPNARLGRQMNAWGAKCTRRGLTKCTLGEPNARMGRQMRSLGRQMHACGAKCTPGSPSARLERQMHAWSAKCGGPGPRANFYFGSDKRKKSLRIVSKGSSAFALRVPGHCSAHRSEYALRAAHKIAALRASFSALPRCALQCPGTLRANAEEPFESILSDFLRLCFRTPPSGVGFEP